MIKLCAWRFFGNWVRHNGRNQKEEEVMESPPRLQFILNTLFFHIHLKNIETSAFTHRNSLISLEPWWSTRSRGSWSSRRPLREKVGERERRWEEAEASIITCIRVIWQSKAWWGIKNNDLRQVQEVLVVPAVHHYPADPEKRRWQRY